MKENAEGLGSAERRRQVQKQRRKQRGARSDKRRRRLVPLSRGGIPVTTRLIKSHGGDDPAEADAEAGDQPASRTAHLRPQRRRSRNRMVSTQSRCDQRNSKNFPCSAHFRRDGKYSPFMAPSQGL